jgi:hypothetical protein
MNTREVVEALRDVASEHEGPLEVDGASSAYIFCEGCEQVVWRESFSGV